MADPIADIIGDHRAFTALQRDRLAVRGIDLAPYELSHLAGRVPEWDQCVHSRTVLERHAIADLENVWNGRPISKILLAELLRVLDGQVAPLIEIIPLIHQRRRGRGGCPWQPAPVRASRTRCCPGPPPPWG